MDFLKFNSKILWVYAFVFFTLTVLLLIYSSRVKVFEDLDIRAVNTSHAELVFITPFHSPIKTRQDVNGNWKTNNVYAHKMYVILHDDSVNTKHIVFIINGEKISVNRTNLIEMNNDVCIEIPYITPKNFFKKISFIINSNLPFEKRSNNLLLFVISTLLAICLLLIIALKQNSKKLALQSIKKNLSIRKIKTTITKARFQITLFALLWFILILITLC